MAESYEFNVFNDRMKRQYLLDQILQGEVAIFGVLLKPMAENHPDYAEWKHSLEEMKKEIANMKEVYEKLGGTYEIQEIRNVTDKS
jgi:hypothetical protein